MEYSFNTDVAKRFKSSDVAAVIHNLAFWQKTNEANNRHFHDGRYWTYNSVKAFSKIFNWLGGPKIRRILEKLEADGILKAGNYNNTTYDRTKWYSIIDHKIAQYYGLSLKSGHLSNLANGSGESSNSNVSNLANGSGESSEPIPDSNTDSNTNKNTDNTPLPPSDYSQEFESFWNSSPKLGAKFQAFKSFKKAKKLTSVDYLIQAIQAQINAEHFKGSDGVSYIPNVSTWLNQRRWEDEIKTEDPNKDPF